MTEQIIDYLDREKKTNRQPAAIYCISVTNYFFPIYWLILKKKGNFSCFEKREREKKKKREPGVLEKREKSFSRNNHQSILENLSYTNVCLIDQHNDINWNSIDCSYTEIPSSISSNANYSHTYNSTSYIHCCLYWFDNQYGDNCTSLSKFCHK